MKTTNYLTCEVEIAEDQNLSKDLEPSSSRINKKI